MDIVKSSTEIFASRRDRDSLWPSARARFESAQLMAISHKPKFRIARDEPIFTIGSCFARAIETILILSGHPMLIKGHGVPAEYFENWNEGAQIGGGVPAGQLSRACFFKYTVHSMSHDLQRTLQRKQYKNDGLIELAKDQWFDPHASGLRNLDLATALENRARLNNAMAEIRNARVVVFTLGLTESWNDLETGIAMNRPPEARFLRALTDRFQFIDYGYDSILTEMADLLALIRSTCNPDMKFVITVSPVPHSATFRDLDILVALSGSKAVLRAVADELNRRYEYVDYFPAYEMAMNSPRNLAWKEDQMHVSSTLVEHITRCFMKQYYGERLNQ